MTVIEHQFTWGQEVYLKTDREQSPRMVLSFTVFKSGEVMYNLVCGSYKSEHFEFELSAEVNVLLATTN